MKEREKEEKEGKGRREGKGEDPDGFNSGFTSSVTPRQLTSPK